MQAGGAQPSFTPEELASAIDLSLPSSGMRQYASLDYSRLYGLPEARYFARSKPETQLFSYTERNFRTGEIVTDPVTGDPETYYFRGGQPSWKYVTNANGEGLTSQELDALNQVFQQLDYIDGLFPKTNLENANRFLTQQYLTQNIGEADPNLPTAEDVAKDIGGADRLRIAQNVVDGSMALDEAINKVGDLRLLNTAFNEYSTRADDRDRITQNFLDGTMSFLKANEQAYDLNQLDATFDKLGTAPGDHLPIRQAFIDGSSTIDEAINQANGLNQLDIIFNRFGIGTEDSLPIKQSFINGETTLGDALLQAMVKGLDATFNELGISPEDRDRIWQDLTEGSMTIDEAINQAHDLNRLGEAFNQFRTTPEDRDRIRQDYINIRITIDEAINQATDLALQQQFPDLAPPSEVSPADAAWNAIEAQAALKGTAGV